jgi:gliding motility-associated-like protein
VLCDYNQFIGNTITGGYAGMTLAASLTGANLNNRYVKNNIRDFYLYGIYVSGSSGTVIDSNSFSRPTRSAVSTFNGIYFTGVSTRALITKNRIFNPFGGVLTSTDAFNGIFFTGVDATVDNENIVTNNVIGQINGQGAQTGISNTSSDNVWYFHNTIALDSASSTSTSTTRGFYQTTTAGGILFYNNMVTISRGGTGTKHAIYLNTTTSGVVADFNNYYLNSPAGNNFVGFYSANRATIDDWRAATNQDATSLSRNPFYVSPSTGNYMPTNGAVDNKGTDAAVATDILGTPRSAITPDIGAYEFAALPCTLPPDAGNTMFNDTTVCQNSPVRLNLTVSSWGAMQTFQWQSSPDGTTWTNFGGVMEDPDTTIVANATIYFRAAVTCGTSTTYSNPVQLLVSPALPTGTYTINKNAAGSYVPGVTGGNFVSFNAAKAAMSCGIVGGPVVFNVVAASGPYLEQLRLDSIPGTSATNTITFNGNGNTISFTATTNTERAIIKLSGVDHIIFDSLVIDASGGTTYGYGVQLQNNADSNVFRNNTIRSSVTSTSTNYAGVVINSSESGATSTGNVFTDGNRFENNTIRGGYYGATLMGGTATATYINNNIFRNNTFTEFYAYGFYVGGTNGTVLEGNLFTRPTRANTNSSVYGVYATSALSRSFSISKNRFTRFFGGIPTNTATFYGVYHNSVDAPAGSEVKVTNNLIYSIEGNAPMYGFYNTGSNNVFYYHNTISFDNSASTPSGQTVGLYQTTAATGIFFNNNIITIRRGGTGTKHGVYMNTVTATEVNANNNNYWIRGTNAHVGYRTSNQTTLGQWQAASSQDAASFTMDPLYADTLNGNYRPQITGLNDKGAPVDVLTDIENVTRSTTTPDPGAYEFAPISCQNPPVAGTASVTPTSGICLEVPIKLNITGHSPLGNITFQWQYSPDGTTNWTNISGIQYFPEFDTVSTVSNYYRAAVTCDGTTTYTNVVSVGLNPLLVSGTYTINNTQPTNYAGAPGANFNSYQDAVTAMLCGVTGPVVFNVAAGTYNEQIHIPYIRNTSATNTVTFQSAGAAGSAVLSFAGTGANNYTLRLDSTRFFTFRNLGFAGTDATNGRVVVLQNETSNVTFVGNTISAPAVTAASTNVVGIYAHAFGGRNITLRNNTVNNGSRGIHFTGTSATVLTLAGHVIDSNKVNNPYNYGIYTEFTNRLRITNNMVTSAGPMANNSAGIFANYADTAFRLLRNTVLINGNTGANAYGIYVQNSRGNANDSAIVASNTFRSDSNNTGTIYGLAIATSKAINVVNNVVALNSTGVLGYGLWSSANTENVNYFNNSINVAATGATNYAGYFNHAATSGTTIHNNIFANSGGGRALYVNNPANFTSDYNMLYGTGPVLVQVNTGTVLTFADFKSWVSTWNWDRWSIGYKPAFISNRDLRPDLANPDVWAMHGRGTQVRGNSYDFNNNTRPTTLTQGVPDLGAYEFFPTAQPTVLLATPAVPAPNTTQTFSYGTDTVMKISWGAAAPPTVSVRRFSGVVPSGLSQPRPDSMFFYTQVQVGGTNNYQYNAKVYYINPWQGSIPQQYQIGLGRTLPSNAWVVGQNSKVDIGKKEISQDGLIYLDRFTGLLNPDARPEVDDSSSNRGKDFWVGYQRTNGFDFNGQDMVVYMGAGDQAANVTITIEGTGGTPWVRTYAVPANTTVTSAIIPKTGADDARLINEGQYNKKGIHITSDVPIVAYAHIYESANSGATMLMPATVWGYEYYTLSSRQNYTSTSYSAFHIVAQRDSTVVEINPSAPTRNGWVPNGGPVNGKYIVRLNKGDVYQVLGAIISGSEGQDLSGSYIKSIAGSQGCFPIAVFAGSTRTGIGCGTSAGGSGDLIIQQIFPYQAWGTKYATAPTSNQNGPTASSHMTNIYRVMVKDPTTQVKRNGTIIPVGQLVNSRYYQFESNTADYIESNKPVLVAQFMSSSGSCPNTSGDGDPEMFYLSPIEQAVKNTQFYRNDETSIDLNFITLIIPTEGLQSLRIDGVNYLAYPVAERYAYTHPNLNGYSVVTKRWATGAGSSKVESDYAFTGIVYGIGSVESYGYNLGTLVKNLNNLSSVTTVLNSTGNATGYTCRGAEFRMTALLPLIPDSIRFNVSQVAGITPNTDVMLRNPTPTATVDVNGVTYYSFTLNTPYVLNTPGTFSIPISYWSAEIESCDKRKDGALTVQVLPKPATNFTITYPGSTLAACQGDAVTLQGDLITSNGIALNQWQWTFAPGGSQTTATGQNQSITYPNAGTYAVTLRGITADGCVSDTVKNVVVNAKPVVTVVEASKGVCPGDNVTFQISNPITGAVYTWYSAATGGTVLGTGTSFTLTNAAPPQSIWVEATANGCTSAQRLQVTATLLGPLTPANVRVLTRDVNSVTFTWDAVALANPAQYMVSVRGAAFVPANGLPNLTHTVTGLRPTDTVSIRVMAIGNASCQTSTSAAVTGQTLPDEIFIPNSFSPNGDGLNDRLMVYGYVIRDMQFTVFNQWGEKIFESRDQTQGWDGSHKGKAQPSGVYIYVAKFVLRDGSTIDRKGTINLVR